MSTITFDTYKLISSLKQRGFSEEQAAGVKEALEQIDLSALATKADVSAVKSDIKADFADFRAEIFKWAVPMLLGQTGVIVALIKFLG
jgi:hypothetical protein